MKEIQKYRKRPAGVRCAPTAVRAVACSVSDHILSFLSCSSAVGLAFGKKFTEEEAIAVSGVYLHHLIASWFCSCLLFSALLTYLYVARPFQAENWRVSRLERLQIIRLERV